jgi:hypothetical protein
MQRFFVGTLRLLGTGTSGLHRGKVVQFYPNFNLLPYTVGSYFLFCQKEFVCQSYLKANLLHIRIKDKNILSLRHRLGVSDY